MLEPLLAASTFALVRTLYSDPSPTLTLAAAATSAATASVSQSQRQFSSAARAAALVLLCPALLLVDNEHFHYNALPLALLLLAQALLLRTRIAAAVLVFMLAVHTKHALAQLAATFGVYALSRLSQQPRGNVVGVVLRGGAVVGTAVVAYGFASGSSTCRSL